MAIKNHANEDAVAYGWFMLIVFLILGAMSYFCIVALYNGVIGGPANQEITDGTMSKQTKDALTFNRDLAMYLPVFMLVGAFIWAMVRGIGGSGATYQSFYTGWVVFVMCCMVGFLMAFCGGMLIDSLYSNLDEQGYIQGAKIPSSWGTIQGDTMFWFINAFYFLCYMVPMLGGGVFVQGIAKRTTGSQYIRG